MMKIKKAILFAVVGGAGGAAISWLYMSLGST
jgi:hypothetical protein